MNVRNSRIHARIARGLIVAALATCISLGAAATASAARPDCAGRGVPDSKISIQRTRTVFQRLSDMGYRNVEPFTLSGMSATDYRALLDEYGLKASARHVD